MGKPLSFDTAMWVSPLIMIIFAVGTGFLFFSKWGTSKLGSFRSQTLLFSFVFLLNFLAYYHDPSRFTSEKECIGGMFPCQAFTLAAGIGTFVMDLFLYYTLMNMSLRTSFDEDCNGKWRKTLILLPPTLLGLYFIIQTYASQRTHNNTTCQDNEHPKGLWPYELRVALYTLIMLVNCIIWFQSFVYVPDKGGFTKVQITQLSDDQYRFGPDASDKVIGYASIAGWALFDMMALMSQLSYDATANKIEHVK